MDQGVLMRRVLPLLLQKKLKLLQRLVLLPLQQKRNCLLIMRRGKFRGCQLIL